MIYERICCLNKWDIFFLNLAFGQVGEKKNMAKTRSRKVDQVTCISKEILFGHNRGSRYSIANANDFRL